MRENIPPNMLRRTRTFPERFLIGRLRRSLLESHDWYRNLAGGWTQGHCMDFMSRREIIRLSPASLDYKLQHGSQAMPPWDAEL